MIANALPDVSELSLIVLTGGISHDPQSFDQPVALNPDRFLKTEFGTREGADDTGRRHDMVFGCGRVRV